MCLIAFKRKPRYNRKHLIWEDGIIPYELSPNMEKSERAFIHEAMLVYYQHSCIKWVQRTTEKDYVYIRKGNLGSGCRANVGKLGSRNIINLGPRCFEKGIIIHEMMHTAGFFHEQSRADRDKYVTINWSNILNGKEKNFRQYTVDQIDDLGTEYNCDSIMHYGRNDFAKYGKESITPKSRNCRDIGQRVRLSETDIIELNLLYKCETSTRTTTTRKPLVPKPVQKMRCPKGWVQTSSACYKSLGKEQINHAKAKSECKKLDSRAILPWFKDDREFEEWEKVARSLEHTLDGFCQYVNACHVWLGMTDSRVEGVWEGTTANGTRCPVKVTHWEPGEPYGRGDCVIHDIERDVYLDYGCGSTFNAICQIRLEGDVC